MYSFVLLLLNSVRKKCCAIDSFQLNSHARIKKAAVVASLPSQLKILYRHL